MRVIYGILLLLEFTLSANSQVLYKCTSPRGDTTFYLLGTCHDLPKDRFYFDSTLDSLIASVDVVFSELYHPGDDPLLSGELMRLREVMFYENGKNLRDFATLREYRSIFRFYRDQFGLSRNQFRDQSVYLPFFMHGRIAYGDRHYVKMDQMIFDRAKAANRPVVLLDSIELLKAAFSIYTTKYDLNWLLENIGDFDRERKEKMRLFDAYLAQDTSVLAEAIDDLPGNTTVIDARNRHWQYVIEARGKRSNFIFAGIAHLLAGRESMIGYFRRRGYNVFPVRLKLSE